jgi:hypothetical protein
VDLVESGREGESKRDSGSFRNVAQIGDLLQHIGEQFGGADGGARMRERVQFVQQFLVFLADQSPAKADELGVGNEGRVLRRGVSVADVEVADLAQSSPPLGTG